jgi:hypothetical protein
MLEAPALCASTTSGSPVISTQERCWSLWTNELVPVQPTALKVRPEHLRVRSVSEWITAPVTILVDVLASRLERDAIQLASPVDVIPVLPNESSSATWNGFDAFQRTPPARLSNRFHSRLRGR